MIHAAPQVPGPRSGGADEVSPNFSWGLGGTGVPPARTPVPLPPTYRRESASVRSGCHAQAARVDADRGVTQLGGPPVGRVDRNVGGLRVGREGQRRGRGILLDGRRALRAPHGPDPAL